MNFSIPQDTGHDVNMTVYDTQEGVYYIGQSVTEEDYQGTPNIAL
jgi:hypothetical protein